MSIRIIGITGPTGAGKSLFSCFLAESGIPVIDADHVYHQMLIPPSECLNALRDAFGSSVIREDGGLDRKELSRIVFGSKEKLELLNRTVLKLVLEQIRTVIHSLEAEGHTTVAVDAPTLIESGFHTECHTVVSVLAPSELRLDRIIKRDNLSREAAESRIRAQHPDSFYEEHSTYLLHNGTDVAAFRSECERLLPLLIGDVNASRPN